MKTEHRKHKDRFAKRNNVCETATAAIDRPPDAEAVFEFNNTRKTPVADGYRPAHLVNGHYLTTGIHHYYNTDLVFPNSTAKGTITFITPEYYPNCLWIGKKINIQEGAHIVGVATITDIYNSVLENKKINYLIVDRKNGYASTKQTAVQSNASQRAINKAFKCTGLKNQNPIKTLKEFLRRIVFQQRKIRRHRQSYWQ